ncbi:hypothetical protein ACG7TL_003167 [Trametes sanguinea]
METSQLAGQKEQDVTVERSAQKRSQRLSDYVIPRSAYDSSEEDTGTIPSQRLSLRIPPRRLIDTAADSVQNQATSPGKSRITTTILTSDSDSSGDSEPTQDDMVLEPSSDSSAREAGEDIEDLLIEDSRRLSEILDAEIPSFSSGQAPGNDLSDKSTSCAQQEDNVPARLRHILGTSQDNTLAVVAPNPKDKGKISRRKQAFEIEKPYFRTSDSSPAIAADHSQRTAQSARTRNTPNPAVPLTSSGSHSTTTSRALMRSSRTTQRRLDAQERDTSDSSAESSPDNGDDSAWSTVPDPVVSAASGEVLLKKQGKAVQEIIDHVNDQVKYHVVFVDGFPETGMRGTLSKELLWKQAKKLGYQEIAGRLAADPDYANKLARVPDNRISHLRSQEMVAEYNVGLIAASTYFLKRLEKNLPYEHPIFIEVIALCFFRGPDSIASKWARKFKSSYPDCPDELEVSRAMVALVATAVHNALMEWRSGAYRAIAFHGAVFEEQYRSHLDILDGIKARSLRTYHNMMHRLYLAASSSTESTINASENDPAATINAIDFDTAPEP